jgi:peptidoglycan/LPS O-acetylase OafA/YrhL
LPHSGAGSAEQGTDARILSLPGGGRLDLLDGLRGLAIGLVLVYHLHEYIPRLWPGQSAFGEGPYLAHAMGFLWVGVDLFYVLSGFFIGYAVLRPVEWKPGKFLLNRVTRILPAYYVSMALVIILLQPAMLTSNRGWVDILLHVLMVHQLQQWTMFSINGPYWTLGIEFSFYLLMIAMAPAWRHPRGWALIGAFLLLSFAWNAGLLVAVPVDQRFFVGVQLPASLQEFAMGMCVARMHRAGKLQPPAGSAHHGRAVICLGAGVSILVFCMHHFIALTTDYWQHSPTVLWSRVLLSGSFALLIGGFVQLNSARGFSRVVRATGLPALGRISFSLYLVHVPIILLLHRHFSALPPGLPRLTILVFAMILTAWAGHRWVERRWHPSA